MPIGATCTMVELSPRSQEYVTVKNKFEESMRASQQLAYVLAIVAQYSRIVKIERVQNTVLHSQYMARKKTMEMKNPPGTMNQVGLFHGCPRDVADKISHHGYNRSFAGKNGKIYPPNITLNK